MSHKHNKRFAILCLCKHSNNYKTIIQKGTSFFENGCLSYLNLSMVTCHFRLALFFLSSSTLTSVHIIGALQKSLHGIKLLIYNGLPLESESRAWLQVISTANYSAPFGPPVKYKSMDYFSHKEPSSLNCHYKILFRHLIHSRKSLMKVKQLYLTTKFAPICSIGVLKFNRRYYLVKEPSCYRGCILLKLFKMVLV